MTQFFKQEEKKPFSYSSIEMRKSSRNNIWWIAGIFLALVTFGVFILS